MDLYNFARFLHIFTFKRVLLIFVTSLLVAGISHLFRYLTKTLFHTEVNLYPDVIDPIVQLIIWGLGFIAISSVWRLITDFYKINIKDNKKYEISFNTEHERAKTEWVFQGNPILNSDGLVVTNTNSGMLLKPEMLWKLLWTCKWK